MAVTYIGHLKNKAIGLSTDIKPEMASGSTFFEYDTGNLLINIDGSTWVVKQPASSTFVSRTIDLKQAAADYDLFNITAQNCLIDFLYIIIPTDNSNPDGDFAGISIQSTDDTPVVFISSEAGAAENLTAGAHLSYFGPGVIASGKKIQLTVIGGATDDECVCTVYIVYRTLVAGGYIIPTPSA